MLIDISVVFATMEIWMMGILHQYILYTVFFNFEELNKKVF